MRSGTISSFRFEENRSETQYAVVIDKDALVTHAHSLITDPENNWFSYIVLVRMVTIFDPTIQVNQRYDVMLCNTKGYPVKDYFPTYSNLHADQIKICANQNEAIELAIKLSKLIPLK